jgi:hypothetical protein
MHPRGSLQEAHFFQGRSGVTFVTEQKCNDVPRFQSKL